MIRVQLKYTEDREPVISGLSGSRSRGGGSYVTADTLPRVSGRDGHRDRHDVARRHDRVRGEASSASAAKLVAFVW